MLLTFDQNIPLPSSFLEMPRLSFVCQAMGESDAIPRMMHSHSDRLEMLFIYKGFGNYIIDSEFYSVKEGDLLAFNAGSIHDERPLPSKNMVIYSCGIENLHLKGLPLNHISPKKQKPILGTGEYTETVKNFFELFIKLSAKQDSLQHEVLHYSCLSFILLAHTLFSQQKQILSKSELSLGQRIKAIIDKRFLEELSISSISEELNVNRYYMSHVFKMYTGYSPKQYLIRRRIGEAQTQLLNSKDSVAHIAERVGYANVNNFHHIFEKIVGMSPVKYKKLWIEKTTLRSNKNEESVQ